MCHCCQTGWAFAALAYLRTCQAHGLDVNLRESDTFAQGALQWRGDNKQQGKA